MNGLWQGDWYSEGEGSGLFYALNATSQPEANYRFVTTDGIGIFAQDVKDEFPFFSSTGSVYQCNGDTLLVKTFHPAMGGEGGQFVPWLRAAGSP